jgi:hypothetical protein
MLKNYTPHCINLYTENGIVEIPSSGIARAAQHTTEVGNIDGVSIVEMTYGMPEGLPHPEDGVYLIVSALTVEAARRTGRTIDDLLLTADLVRDEAGRVVGCRALARP